ncbi:MAG: PEP-CTERM sorting domain-containing protein [Planctomycetota bacterium]
MFERDRLRASIHVLIRRLLAATYILAIPVTSEAAFVIEFAPSQTTVTSNGLDQRVTVDMVIRHDGSPPPAEFSGFTVFMGDTGPNLVIDSVAETDFDYENDASVKQSRHTGLYMLGASSTTQQHSFGSGSTQSLLSVDFLLDGSVNAGVFDLNLTLHDVTTGTANNGSLTSIANSVTAQNGVFTVLNATAVPEPSSVLFLVGTGILAYRRRKAKHRVL